MASLLAVGIKQQWMGYLLTPKGPRMHKLKRTNSIDHIVKNMIHMGPNSISPESVKDNIARADRKLN